MTLKLYLQDHLQFKNKAAASIALKTFQTSQSDNKINHHFKKKKIQVQSALLSSDLSVNVMII